MLALLAVVFSNTLRFTSKQTQAEARINAALDEQTLAEHLAGAIRFATISPQDSAQTDTAAFADLHLYIRKTFPKVQALLEREVGGDYGLLFTRTKSSRSCVNLLLALLRKICHALPVLG